MDESGSNEGGNKERPVPLKRACLPASKYFAHDGRNRGLRAGKAYMPYGDQLEKCD